MLEDIDVKAGDLLFQTDKPLDTAFFILEGQVLLKLTIGQKELSVLIEENHFIGDAAVVVTDLSGDAQPSYHAEAIAKTNVKAVPIPVSDIKAELESCSPMLKAWFASFTKRVLSIISDLSASR